MFSLIRVAISGVLNSFCFTVILRGREPSSWIWWYTRCQESRVMLGTVNISLFSPWSIIFLSFSSYLPLVCVSHMLVSTHRTNSTASTSRSQEKNPSLKSHLEFSDITIMSRVKGEKINTGYYILFSSAYILGTGVSNTRVSIIMI